jgi:hypothetical protein
MNNTWQVTYTLYEDASMTFGKAGMFSLKMNVIADSYSQACQIVESMFPNCRAEGAILLS